jgi:hypothetical protein
MTSPQFLALGLSLDAPADGENGETEEARFGDAGCHLQHLELLPCAAIRLDRCSARGGCAPDCIVRMSVIEDLLVSPR